MMDKVGDYRNKQGQYDLALIIRTVLNSDEGAVNRLIKIRTICNDAILAYEDLNAVEDDEPYDDGTDDKIILMDPKLVKLNTTPSKRDIATQMERLEREGQIEPIALTADNSPDLAEWAYAEAEIMAAMQLGWPTMLFTYDYKDRDYKIPPAKKSD